MTPPGDPDHSAQPEHAIGWDHPETVRYYRAFNRRHARYRQANRELAKHACLRPGMTVLDVGAGLGGTAEAVLKYLGPRGRVICVEPATAMRTAGAARLTDPRVRWTDSLPLRRRVDRVLCGAGIWQLLPLAETIAHLRTLLKPGGALCFNMPSLYLGEADQPGGGLDPQLLQLPTLLARQSTAKALAMPPSRTDLEKWLNTAGLRADGWSFRLRITQRAYRDWLKLPVISEGMMAGIAPRERARLIDAAFKRCDPNSWRFEYWRGWTAWAE